MSSPLYGKISSACKAAAKRKFKVWPSAYASGSDRDWETQRRL